MVSLRTFPRVVTRGLVLVLLLGFLFGGVAARSATAASDIAAQPQHIANQQSALIYFYTPTCPFCIQQGRFLDSLQADFPDLEIIRLNVTERTAIAALDEVLLDHPDAHAFRGSVPLTFFGEQFFSGFSPAIGDRMRQAVVQQHAGTNDEVSVADIPTTVLVPLWGEVSLDSLSAPALAMTLGIVDGFNVCSVGALILILSLVLQLRERRLVLLYGSLFLFITAAVYFALIVLWHQLFSIIAPLITFFEVVVGLIAISGGIFFFREFLRFRRFGVTCDSGSGRLIANATSRVQAAFTSKRHGHIAIATITFAAIVVLVEFPCSAAIPLTLAGALSTMELSTTAVYGSFAIFMLFYLLDELIIFLIAVFSMRLWFSSSRFVVYSTLLGAVVLFSFGLFYLYNGLLH